MFGFFFSETEHCLDQDLFVATTMYFELVMILGTVVCRGNKNLIFPGLVVDPCRLLSLSPCFTLSSSSFNALHVFLVARLCAFVFLFFFFLKKKHVSSLFVEICEAVLSLVGFSGADRDV